MEDPRLDRVEDLGDPQFATLACSWRKSYDATLRFVGAVLDLQGANSGPAG
jgi:hypothetical protein